jgi:hypothetical protein
MNKHAAVRFKSFEDTLALLAALIAGGIAYKLFQASALTSSLLGVFSAAAVAYTSLMEFTLRDNAVTVRTHMREVVIPLAHIERVDLSVFWGGLPGRFVNFILTRPPASVNGELFRTGLVSWPSASQWVESVRSALHEAKPPKKR